MPGLPAWENCGPASNAASISTWLCCPWPVASSAYGDFQSFVSRSKSCYSQYPLSTDAASTAGEHAYYCAGAAVNRGSLGRLPSWWLLNMNAAWEHNWGVNRLRFEFNMGNVLNKNTLVFVNPYYGYYNGSTLVKENRYGGQAYLAPRSASFVIRYNWN
jgi:hypothetical protein